MTKMQPKRFPTGIVGCSIYRISIKDGRVVWEQGLVCWPLFFATFGLATVTWAWAGTSLMNENYHCFKRTYQKYYQSHLHDHLFFLMTFRIEAAIQGRVSFMPLVPVAVFVEGEFFYGKNASTRRQCPGMGSQAGNVLPPIWTTCTTFASWVMFKVQITGILVEIDSFY